MFYAILAISIDLSPIHREIMAFKFVAKLMGYPVYIHSCSGCLFLRNIISPCIYFPLSYILHLIFLEEPKGDLFEELNDGEE